MKNHKYFSKLITRLPLLIGILLLLRPLAAQAAENLSLEQTAACNDSCLRCHAAEGLKMKLDGQVVSLYVNEQEYLASQHGTNLCNSCHTDIIDYPHVGALKGKNLISLKQKVNENCERCHADVAKAYSNSAHDKANKAGKAVYCWSCHGVHNILKKEDSKAAVAKKNIPETCGSCHAERILESYRESFHGKAVTLGSVKAATCVDCHGAHDILGPLEPASSVAKTNVPKTCAKCHYSAELNFADGTEHWMFERDGPGAPMYWTLKFLVWLTIGTIAIFFVHQELDLYRRLRKLGKNGGGRH